MGLHEATAGASLYRGAFVIGAYQQSLCKAPIERGFVMGTSLGRVSIYLGQQKAARGICPNFRII